MSHLSVKVGAGQHVTAGIVVEVAVMEAARSGVVLAVDHVSERWYFEAEQVQSVEIATITPILGDGLEASGEIRRKRLRYAGERFGELIQDEKR